MAGIEKREIQLRMTDILHTKDDRNGYLKNEKRKPEREVEAITDLDNRCVSWVHSLECSSIE